VATTEANVFDLYKGQGIFYELEIFLLLYFQNEYWRPFYDTALGALKFPFTPITYKDTECMEYSNHACCTSSTHGHVINTPIPNVFCSYWFRKYSV